MENIAQCCHQLFRFIMFTCLSWNFSGVPDGTRDLLYALILIGQLQYLHSKNM